MWTRQFEKPPLPDLLLKRLRHSSLGSYQDLMLIAKA